MFVITWNELYVVIMMGTEQSGTNSQHRNNGDLSHMYKCVFLNKENTIFPSGYDEEFMLVIFQILETERSDLFTQQQ
jgi:hypothetical protein